MNTKATFAAFLLASILWVAMTLTFQITSSGSPQARIPGVRAGNWIKYGNINVTWDSTDPQAEIDPSLALANQTEWFQHTVLEVLSPIITFRNETHFESSPPTSNTRYINIDDGSGDGYLMFISAELSANDALYEEDLGYINETQTRMYVGLARETNHLNITRSFKSENPFQEIGFSFNWYWDKETGILTERQASSYNQTEQHITSWSRSDIIVDTSIWDLNNEPVDTEPPNANAGDDMAVTQGEIVQFDASNSSDNIGIVTYEWDFGDGTTQSETNPTTTHTYTQPGTYTVTLTVSDATDLAATDHIEVVVKTASNENFLPLMLTAAAIVFLLGTLILYMRRKRRFKPRKRRVGLRKSSRTH